MTIKIPENILALARNRQKLAAKLAKAASAESAAKSELEACDALLRNEITSAKLESIRVNGYNFTPGHTAFLKTTDWDKYWAWARQDRLGVYVQKRPSVTAVYEQLDAGKKVPGVERGQKDTLHVTKAGK